MALQSGQLEAIAAAIVDPADPALAGELRGAFPGLSFTVCADDDIIGSRPVLEGAGFNLYLVEGSSHCLSLTRDPESAAGVVVAWTSDDE